MLQVPRPHQNSIEKKNKPFFLVQKALSVLLSLQCNLLYPGNTNRRKTLTLEVILYIIILYIPTHTLQTAKASH